MKSSFPPVEVECRGAKAEPSAFGRACSSGASIDRRRGAFTLVELLVVMAVVIILIGLSTPVVNALKNSGDVTSAAYDMSDALARARASALANNTYVWVGFFEEDGSRSSTRPATPGIGRIVLSTVFSRDGTSIYDPGATTQTPLDFTKLGQYGKPLKIDHAHLNAYSCGDGTGQGGDFVGRPIVKDVNINWVSNSDPAKDSKYVFSYPLGSVGASAQYTFTKMIQFSPRGEARINCVSMEPLIEIGLMRSNGAVADTASKNVVAIQMTGIASNLTIYRP